MTSLKTARLLVIETSRSPHFTGSAVISDRLGESWLKASSSSSQSNDLRIMEASAAVFSSPSDTHLHLSAQTLIIMAPPIPSVIEWNIVAWMRQPPGMKFPCATKASAPLSRLGRKSVQKKSSSLKASIGNSNSSSSCHVRLVSSSL